MRAHPGAAFVMFSGREQIRNSDVTYPFRAESSFYYLTGFEEPDSCLALIPGGAPGAAYRTVLFVRERNPERELWDGERYGIERAVSLFGADEAFPVAELDKKLAELLKESDTVFYRMGWDETTDRRMLSVFESVRLSQGRSGRALVRICDPQEAIGEMRLYKTSDEVTALREASRISALAHKTAMQEARPGMKEYEIEALVDYVFRKNGCQRVGYGSIVAAGKNATCLHYRDNNDTLNSGDLILIDAGGEFDFFTADITRTFPVGRTFSQAQARLYDVVLKAQKAVIDLAKPGLKYTRMHEVACEILAEGLISIGLLKGTPKEAIQSLALRRFYPHGTGHWLGMDVHDVGLYRRGGEPRELEAGMVFTVEPGLYCQPTDRDCPEEYRGIGVRIEDDILITANGHEVLTSDVPKERAEIEALRKH